MADEREDLKKQRPARFPPNFSPWRRRCWLRGLGQ